MQSKIVIYTAIFGKRDVLLEPEFVPENIDFVCFTDQSFKSSVWEVRKVKAPIKSDLARSNRFYKILPHKVLPEYETSVYIDGNVVVKGKIVELIEKYLSDANMAGFDHAYYKKIPVNSMEEQKKILLTSKQKKRNGEDFEKVLAQFDAYKKEGFPDDTGFLWCMTLIRKHGERDVIETMEAWWGEILNRTRRDQMSFNYVAWKNKLHVNLIPLDGSDNAYIKRVSHYKPKHKTLIRNALLRLGFKV